MGCGGSVDGECELEDGGGGRCAGPTAIIWCVAAFLSHRRIPAPPLLGRGPCRQLSLALSVRVSRDT